MIKKTLINSHPWFNLGLDHYLLVYTKADLEAEMNNSLLLSILILPQSKLGQSIASQHSWSGLSLDNLLQNIFTGKNLSMLV